MHRKGLDRMPYAPMRSETFARLAFGCDFDTAKAYEESRVAQWWKRQRLAVRARLTLRRLFSHG